ncbi:MAG: hypothetical protein SFY70_04075 [Bacteroidia bacterium]|nr:hypothetical protein [Bacteroidia bacterium]
MTDTEALERLRTDFVQVADLLAQLATTAIAQGVTQHPIFVATEVPLALGLPAIDRGDHGLTYHFRISLVDELVRKQLLEAEKRAEFLNAYGDARQRAAILLVHGTGAQFVFLPYDSSSLTPA